MVGRVRNEDRTANPTINSGGSAVGPNHARGGPAQTRVKPMISRRAFPTWRIGYVLPGVRYARGTVCSNR